MTYQFVKTLEGNVRGVQREGDNAFIPLSQGNRDCVRFLLDWKNGATVLDADGSPAPYCEDAVRTLGLEPPL